MSSAVCQVVEVKHVVLLVDSRQRLRQFLEGLCHLGGRHRAGVVLRAARRPVFRQIDRRELVHGNATAHQVAREHLFDLLEHLVAPVRHRDLEVEDDLIDDG